MSWPSSFMSAGGVAPAKAMKVVAKSVFCVIASTVPPAGMVPGQ